MLERELRAFFKSCSKRDFDFPHAAPDLNVTPAAVRAALRHPVAHDRCRLFPRLAGELTAGAQGSVENCVCGSGELAFCIKREGWEMRVCVFVPVCVCFLKPVMSPSKSPRTHQLAWRVAFTDGEKTCCIIGPLGWHWPEIELTDRQLGKQDQALDEIVWMAQRTYHIPHTVWSIVSSSDAVKYI